MRKPVRPGQLRRCKDGTMYLTLRPLTHRGHSCLLLCLGTTWAWAEPAGPVVEWDEHSCERDELLHE